ncbi:unnamed protein product [Prunus armeniaca]|uniref:PRA1 family protein n=1 Tax=Prunus armeniaca TaxID=36596 RepID=A0A6J5VBG5_PRUAR|nr:unnamed protein product [Prunus armeniaca]
MSIGLVSQVKEVSQSAIATLWSWGKLLEPTALSLPSNLSEATTRLAQNLTHFRSNYTLVLLHVVFRGTEDRVMDDPSGNYDSKHYLWMIIRS